MADIDINNPKDGNQIVSPDNLHMDPVYVLYEDGQPVGDKVQLPE